MANKKYIQGRGFEYRVRNYLTAQGWVVFRSAGSHSPADLIAIRPRTVWLVQCKGGKASISRADKEELMLLAEELEVTPVLVTRLDGQHNYRLIVEKLVR